MTRRIDGAKPATVFRRAKRTPAEDCWHTLQIGVPLAIVLFFVLPLIFRALGA